MTTFIESERCVIKVPEQSDYDYFFGLMNDKKVMQYIGSGGIRTPEQIHETINKAILHYQKHHFSVGGVFDKSTNAFIGRAGIFYLAWDDTQPEIEIGYTLHQQYWGKGIATELAKALIKWGFANLNIDKLVGVTIPENVASQRVLIKAGMHSVGTAHCYDMEVLKFEIFKK